MLRSSTSSCCSNVKSALNWSLLGLNFDFGAPGQSTLNSGLAMSVTRRLYFFRRRSDSAISLEFRSSTFLFHMPRSSIQLMPNLCEAISHARPKSCPISSLMTAILKGDLERFTAHTAAGMVVAAAVAPNAVTKSRRETGEDMTYLSIAVYEVV